MLNESRNYFRKMELISFGNLLLMKMQRSSHLGTVNAKYQQAMAKAVKIWRTASVVTTTITLRPVKNSFVWQRVFTEHLLGAIPIYAVPFGEMSN